MAHPDYWWIQKDDGSYLELSVRTYTPKININYELMDMSDRNYVSIDRGVATDRYSAELTFSGRTEYIESVIIVLDDLRLANKDILMGGFPESVNIFGDHVDYSQPMSILVEKFGQLRSSKFNTMEWDVVFLATDVTYTGINQLPKDMKCLTMTYKTVTEWNTHINETYNRDNYFVDRDKDKYYFEGTYILSDVDNNNLFNWWKQNRGNKLYISEEDFGVNNMFGPKFSGTTNHNVIIQDIQYTIYAPKLRKIKLNLLRVD